MLPTIYKLSFLIATYIFSSCSASEYSSTAAEYHVIPFRTIGEKIPVIRASLNEKCAWFIVDTGASVTLLNATEASHFGFSMRNARGEMLELTGFTDKLTLSATSFCRLTIGNLKIGPTKYRSHEMSALFTTIESREKMRIAGILGSDILAKYGMNINYESKTLSYRVKAHLPD